MIPLLLLSFPCAFFPGVFGRLSASTWPVANAPPQVLLCAPSTTQIWKIVNGSSETFDIVGTVVNAASLNVNPQWVPGANVTVVAGNYGGTSPDAAAPWTWGAGGTLLATPQGSPSPLCLALALGSIVPGSQVWLETCTGTAAQEQPVSAAFPE